MTGTADILQPSASWQYIDRWEENDWTLNKEEYQWLARRVGEIGIATVLEFGPGSSTWAFLEHDCSVWSLENDAPWLEKARSDFREFPHVHLTGYEVKADLEFPGLWNGPYDCAMVDAPNGGGYFKYHARLCSLDYARTRTNLIFLHDANRVKEQRSIEYMEDKGWAIVDRCPNSYRGFVLLAKRADWNPRQ